MYWNLFLLLSIILQKYRDISNLNFSLHLPSPDNNIVFCIAFGMSTDAPVDNPTYTYAQLLNRVFECLHDSNPDFQNRQKITIKPPQLMRGEEGP